MSEALDSAGFKNGVLVQGVAGAQHCVAAEPDAAAAMGVDIAAGLQADGEDDHVLDFFKAQFDMLVRSMTLQVRHLLTLHLHTADPAALPAALRGDCLSGLKSKMQDLAKPATCFKNTPTAGEVCCRQHSFWL